MADCPDGHPSTNDDYCSVCGLSMPASAGASDPTGSDPTTVADPVDPTTVADPADPAAPSMPPPGLAAVPSAAAPPSTGSLACPNCSEPHGRDDVFCENCGYDFITGSLPAPEPALTSAAPPPVVAIGTAPAVNATVLAEIMLSADATFHERMDPDGVLSLPDPLPPSRTESLTNSPVLLGRASPSRNIHPDLDVSDDPAASGRHARLDRRPDGTWTITDLGSTNGTYLGQDYTPLKPNVSTPIPLGTAVYLGAWTRLDLIPTVTS